MPRQYNKKSSYWEQRKSKPQAIQAEEIKSSTDQFFDIKPETFDENLTSIAACGGGSTETARYRRGVSAGFNETFAYANIKSGMLPYENKNGSISIEEIIELCQLAYANISVARNAVEVLTEFSNSELVIQSDNKAAKKFFKEWFKKIDLFNLKEQFFREYYRSGNIFYYRLDGMFTKEAFQKLKREFSSSNKPIPVKYVLMNPARIRCENGLSYTGKYVKVLSDYEIAELKKRTSDEAKAVYNALPVDAQKAIDNHIGGYRSTILIPLNPNQVHSLFYKKQDYEPLATPMLFPILNDLEWKLMLQKTDMALLRSIEHAFLLVTTGDKDKGINPASVNGLKEIFKNRTIGRVLVHDWSTKAEWIIPDIKELLGKEKYEVVEANIRDGLQSIILGDDKFANAQIKSEIFIERLKSGREYFLNKFLLPEMEKVADIIGIKGSWSVKFREIHLRDPINLKRLYVRLAELGILHPEEVFKALENGELPDGAVNLENQEKYLEEKNKGYYLPLVGGGARPNDSKGRPDGTGTPKTQNTISRIKASEDGDETKISATKLATALNLAEDIKAAVNKSLAEKYGIKEFTDKQKNFSELIAKAIFINEENPLDKIADYLENPQPIKLELNEELSDTMLKYDCSEWQAAAILKSKV